LPRKPSVAPGRKSFALLLPIYFSTMTNKVNHDHSFTVEDLIYDAIVTYVSGAKTVQTLAGVPTIWSAQAVLGAQPTLALQSPDFSHIGD
jgi:hypothetical protein